MAFTLTLVVAGGAGGRALAWGATGHRMIGRIATESLPADLPAFLRTPQAIESVGELAREPDRWKASGRVHDSDRDAAHFLDLGDDGKVLGGPSLAALPPTRADYEAALRAVGADGWRAGYLPYAIIDGWQQLAKDFAYWRVDAAAEARAVDPARRAWFAADRQRREALILRDLGAFAHYVGDGSQPMHVSAHFNGWGAYPNPQNFTQVRFHAAFEGAFVHDNVKAEQVRAALAPPAGGEGDITRRTVAYLLGANAQIEPLYRLYGQGGFEAGDPRGVAFAAARLAAGAAALRDFTAEAWRVSALMEVGYPAVKVADVAAGRVDPYPSLLGED